MITIFRKNIDSEEGQTIILGAVMVLVLAFGLLVTINLGQMVQDKIRLQNTSDSAAYSMAVAEAQAFNFIAFTNRTQAAHYNGMMTMQTLQTVVLFIESMLGTILDIVWFICGILDKFPPLKGVVDVIAGLIGKIVSRVTEVVGEILTGGAFIKTWMGRLNKLQYYTSALVALMVGFRITDIGKFLKTNEDRALIGGKGGKGAIVNLALIALNGFEYIQSFDFDTLDIRKDNNLLNIFNDDDVKDKKNGYADPSNATKRSAEVNQRLEIMGEIVNATRSENGGSARKDTEWNLKEGGWSNNSNRGVYLDIASFGGKFPALNDMLVLKTGGQTKLINANRDIGVNPTKSLKIDKKKGVETGKKSDPYYGFVQDIRYDESQPSRGYAEHPGNGTSSKATSSFSRGDTMASDQFLDFMIKVELGGSALEALGIDLGFERHWGFGVYMFSDNRGGEYYRWEKPNMYSGGLYNGAFDKVNDELEFSYYSSTIYARIPLNFWDLFPGVIKTGISWTIDIAKCDWRDETHENNCKNDNTFIATGRYHGCWWGGGKGKGFRGIFDRQVRTHRTYCNGDKAAHDEDPAKQYYFGMYRYLKFNPTDEVKADFNQPSTWMVANMPTNATSGTSKTAQPWHFNTEKTGMKTTNSKGTGVKKEYVPPVKTSLAGETKITTSNQNHIMTTTNPIMGDGSTYSSYNLLNMFAPGINTFSRARVYYHRPGNWSEHPNFFNPYWRVHLAPIGPKLNGFLSVEPVGPPSNSGIIGDLVGMFGGLQGAFNDILTDIVMRIVTH